MEKKKKTIKIDFRYYWWHFNPENNIFINLLKKDYNVILDEKNPDYVFFSTYDGKRPIQSKTYGKIGKQIENFSPLLYKILRNIYYFRKERWKTPIIEGDFVKIFFTVESARPNMKRCDWAFTHEYDEELKNPRHLRIPGYTFNAIKDPNELVKPNNIDVNKIMKEKKKFCVFICSNDVDFRNNFFKQLNKYKKVESWGKCLNNMGKGIPKLVEINKDIKSKGETKEHIERNFLEQYKFIIAFENASNIGYTSERKSDPMRVNTIPIYWGNPLVHRDFNTKSFINYHDFEKEVKKNIPKIFFEIPIIDWLTKRHIEKETFKKMIKKIMELDKNDNLYKDMLKQPWYNDNKPPIYLDREKIRNRLREIIETGKKVKLVHKP
tara:strand:+ start:51288 stop:52427 length:1140 start_codon:yes stop_codon:yes gene_type:complete